MHPSEETLRVFHDSLDRCLHTGLFFETFYGRLLSVSPETLLADLLSEHRGYSPALSLYHCMGVALGREEATALMHQAGRRYRCEGLPVEHYTLWLESLLGAAAACDPRFDEAACQAWRAMLEPGLSIARAAHRDGNRQRLPCSPWRAGDKLSRRPVIALWKRTNGLPLFTNNGC